MAELTLRQAATQVGVSRQTVYRLVKQGRLSATVRPDGQKVVDTAELLRVFGRLTHETGATVSATGAALLPETPPATAQQGPKPAPQAMTTEQLDREAAISDRAFLLAERDAARAALQEAREREAKLLDLLASQNSLLAGQTRLLEHKAEVEAPPRGFWRRVFGK